MDSSCILCEGKKFHLRYPFGRPVYCCVDCGLLQRLEEYETAYDEDTYVNIQKSYWKNQLSNWKLCEDIPYYQWVLDCLESHDPGRKLIDVGCGLGSFLKYAESRGWEVEGTEMSQFAIRHNQEKLSLKVFPPSKLQKSPSSSYDVISLWDFLEHTREVNDILKECRRLLKDSGSLVIRTINENTLFNGIAIVLWKLSFNRFDYFLCRMHEPLHVLYFTRSNLQQLLKKNGFNVVSSKYHDLPARRVSQGFFLTLSVFGINFLQKLFGCQYEQILICSKK